MGYKYKTHLPFICFFLLSLGGLGQDQTQELTGFGGQYVGNIATSNYVRKTKLFLYPKADGTISGLVSKKITSGPILIKFEGSYQINSVGSIAVDVTKSYKVNREGEKTGGITSSLAIMDFTIHKKAEDGEYELSNKARWLTSTRPKEYVKYDLSKKLEPSILFASLARLDAATLVKELSSMRKKGLSVEFFVNGSKLTLLDQAVRMGSMEMTETLLNNGIPTSAQQLEVFQGRRISNQDLLEHVEKVQRANTVYRELMKKLGQQAYHPNWEELLQLEDQLGSEFASLLPSQINKLRSKIEEYRPKSAYDELVRLTEVQLTDTDEYGKTRKISDFTQHNYVIYNDLSGSYRTLLKEQLDQLLAQSLVKQMEQESQVLTALPVQIASIESLNKRLETLQKRHREYLSNAAVKETIQLYKVTKSQLVVQLEDQIRSRIVATKTIGSLERINRIYLANIGSHSAISRLQNDLQNQKRQIEQYNAQVAKQEKEEVERLLNIRRKTAYQKILKNSKRTVSEAEMEQVISRLRRNNQDGLTYFDEEDFDIKYLLANYLQHITENRFYISDKLRSKAMEVTSQRESSGKIVFQTRQNLDCYYDPSTGLFTYFRKTEVDKVVNSSAWRIAQRCSSVKALFDNPNKYNFLVVGVTVDEDSGIPVIWHTEVTEEVCGQRAVYDNCRTPCNATFRKGSNNFYLYITDALERYNH